MQKLENANNKVFDVCHQNQQIIFTDSDSFSCISNGSLSVNIDIKDSSST